MKTKLDFGSSVVSHAALLSLLKEYKRPNDKISHMIETGILIKLKKGFYIQTDSAKAPKELIANHLYGPSYISGMWALSYYGMIVERVFEVTSSSIKRSKSFDTPLGRFGYTQIPKELYAVGIVLVQKNDASFMMASPEKALCDMLYGMSNLRISSSLQMKTLLIDDLRIDEDALADLDTAIVKACAATGKKSKLFELLAKTLEEMR